MPADIFISYRRMDSEYAAGRIFDHLERVFPNDIVFIDVDSIAPGHDFASVLQERLSSSRVMIIVIGKNWLARIESRTNSGLRRIDNPEDFVRLEIEEAIRKNVKIIPILLNQMRMPLAAELPTTIRQIADCAPVVIRESHFREDLSALIILLCDFIPHGISGGRPSTWYGRKALSRFAAAWKKAAMPNPHIAGSLRNEERALLDMTGQVMGTSLVDGPSQEKIGWKKETAIEICISRLFAGFLLSRYLKNGAFSEDELPKDLPRGFENAKTLMSRWLEGQLSWSHGRVSLAHEALWCDGLADDLAQNVWAMPLFGASLEGAVHAKVSTQSISTALHQCTLIGVALHRFIQAGAPDPIAALKRRPPPFEICPPTPMTGAIWIAALSRDNTSFAVGRIFDRLDDAFSNGVVETYAHNDNALINVERLVEEIEDCHILVVVVGKLRLDGVIESPTYVGSQQTNGMSADSQNLIATALRRSIRIIPLLIEGARMPEPQDLPLTLKAFANCQAMQVRHARFGADMDGLISTLRGELDDAEAGLSGDKADLPTRDHLNSFIEGWFVHGLYNPQMLANVMTVEERSLATSIAMYFAMNLVGGDLDKKLHAPELGWSKDEALLVCAPKVFTGFLLDRYLKTGSFGPERYPIEIPTGKNVDEVLLARYVKATFFEDMDGFSVWGDQLTATLANYLGTRSLIAGITDQESELRKNIPGKATARICIARGVIMHRFLIAGAPEELPKGIQVT